MTAETVANLIGLVEDTDLEFKSQPWDSTNGGSKECALDIADKANASGALVVVGIEEDGDGRAKAIAPIPTGGAELGLRVRRTAFEVPIDWRLSHGFRRTVLTELAQAVPYGQTISYKELSTRSGKPNASRATGSAMATNPIPIVMPCHRVIGSGGSLVRGGSRCHSGCRNVCAQILWRSSSSSLER